MKTPSALVGPLQDFGMAQRADRVVEAGGPMVFHALAGEFEVLRFLLVLLRSVDQLDDVVDLAVGLRV